jgi:hypothetical protein
MKTSYLFVYRHFSSAINDGCMRRSCGYPDLRNGIIENNPALRIRGNSCSASLALERVALHLVLHLPKIAFAFTWTLERLLVIPTKRAIAPRGLCPMSTSQCCTARYGGSPHPNSQLTIRHSQLGLGGLPPTAYIAWSIVTPESFIRHHITRL